MFQHRFKKMSKIIYLINTSNIGKTWMKNTVFNQDLDTQFSLEQTTFQNQHQDLISFEIWDISSNLVLLSPNLLNWSKCDALILVMDYEEFISSQQQQQMKSILNISQNANPLIQYHVFLHSPHNLEINKDKDLNYDLHHTNY